LFFAGKYRQQHCLGKGETDVLPESTNVDCTARIDPSLCARQMNASAFRNAAQRWLQPGKMLILALVYFAGAKLGLHFPTHNGYISLFWLPTGIAVAALLRWGTPYTLPGIFLGALLFDLTLDMPASLAVVGSICDTLSPLSVVWLLKRWRFDLSLTRQYDLFVLIAASALGTLLPAVIGTGTLVSGGQLPFADLPIASINRWLADTVSVLLAGPLLMSLTRASIRKLLRRPGELLLSSLLLCTTGGLVFFVPYGDSALPLAFLPLPLVLWAALRIGVTGTSLAVLTLSLLTTIGTALGRGVFGTLPGEEGMYMAWLYMFTLVLCGLMVITILGERKKIEIALMRANELLTVAQHKAKAGIWDWDLPSGKLTWTNEMYILFGLDPKTSRASFDIWHNLIHPDDRITAGDTLSEAVRNGIQLFSDYRIVLPDGTTKWINSSGKTSCNMNNEAIRMTGLCIDVTERKQAEERLRFSEELLRQTQSVAAVGSWRIDLQSNEIVWSAETCRIFGITGSAPQDYEHFIALAHPDDRAKIRSAWIAALKGAPFRMQHRIIVNGETRWVEEQAQLDFNAQGRLLVATGSVQDITARVKTDEQLRNSLRQLEEKELSKTRFLAAAGHDLRQPMTAATLYVDTLKLTAPTPRQNEIIGKLELSMNTFSGLLERLLDISKFDAGLVKPQIDSYNLANLFIWLEHNFAQEARSKRLRFLLFFPMSRQLIVRTDIGLLQSVLMNLVSNAIKFTAQGGILIGARLRGDTVLVQVWDTGIGMDDTNIHRIFDEFYQVANPQRNRTVGLGLGLSIAQRAMTLLGGEVTVHSRPGRGSVFSLHLPLNGLRHEIVQPPYHKTPAAAANTMLMNGKRIVVVEDDALVADALINLLQGTGAEVRHFHNAEEALRHADIAKADYFVVDYALGGALSGLQFLETLQQKQQAPLRAVVVTGETSSQFIAGVADSPWPVLHKPVNSARLVSCLFAGQP
jgi:PAS domain S-box-containing protein